MENITQIQGYNINLRKITKMVSYIFILLFAVELGLTFIHWGYPVLALSYILHFQVIFLPALMVVFTLTLIDLPKRPWSMISLLALCASVLVTFLILDFIPRPAVLVPFVIIFLYSIVSLARAPKDNEFILFKKILSLMLVILSSVILIGVGSSFF